MDGLWILLGSGLSTSAGVLFWFLNSKTSQSIQTQALTRERQNREDDAIRTMRRERLKPVFDLLLDVQNWLASQAGQVLAHLGVPQEELPAAPEKWKLLLSVVVNKPRVDSRIRKDLDRIEESLTVPTSSPKAPKAMNDVRESLESIYRHLEHYIADVRDPVDEAAV